jgi:hypothetical protein
MVQQAQRSLRNTLVSLEAQKQTIEQQIKALRSALDALEVRRPNLAGRRLRSPMTPAERRSVSKRMKAYWAKKRAQRKAAK